MRLFKTVLCAVAIVMGASGQAQGLKDAYKDYFSIGVAVNMRNLGNDKHVAIIKNNYNSITAENDFKPQSVQPQEGQWNFRNADAIADFCRENGIKLRGHCLAWHSQVGQWMFQGANGGQATKEELYARMKTHITTVMQRYKDIIYCWDVVNEAVADGTNECKADDPRRVRTIRGGTTNYFYDVIGPDYVELSFKYARQAAKKANANIKLFYNDYNTFYSPKKEAIAKLIESINKDEKLCDGVGMQGYVGGYGQQSGCMNANDIKLFESAIKFYSNMGLEVHVTELALRNYEKDKAEQHAAYYENFFKMLANVADETGRLTCVAIWGICDNPSLPKNDYSYKMNGPYCGMFNYDCTRKPEYFRVAKVL